MLWLSKGSHRHAPETASLIDCPPRGCCLQSIIVEHCPSSSKSFLCSNPSILHWKTPEAGSSVTVNEPEISLQAPLPERPQLLPHRPRAAADVGHDLLLVLDVLKDLLWVMALSLLLTSILIRVAGSPAYTPWEEKGDKLFLFWFPAKRWFAQDPTY